MIGATSQRGRTRGRSAPYWSPRSATNPAARIMALLLAFCPRAVTRSPPPQIACEVRAIPSTGRRARTVQASASTTRVNRATRGDCSRLYAAQNTSTTCSSRANSLVTSVP